MALEDSTALEASPRSSPPTSPEQAVRKSIPHENARTREEVYMFHYLPMYDMGDRVI
jgi:hypothetical protein